jgi:hypothetical protein
VRKADAVVQVSVQQEHLPTAVLQPTVSATRYWPETAVLSVIIAQVLG